MYDPMVKDLGCDAFGDPHPVRGFWLVDALERWGADQPDGRKATGREISNEVMKYRKFQSPASHGPGRCARIVATDPRWLWSGHVLVKCGHEAKQAAITAANTKADAPPLLPKAVPQWIAATSPGRASAKDHAAAYNVWATANGCDHCHHTAIAQHLRAAGYTIVARPNNRAIYAKTEWI